MLKKLHQSQLNKALAVKSFLIKRASLAYFLVFIGGSGANYC
jgi:hypothetical protein